MAQATGSASRISLQLESTWGVLPSTPAMIEINAATYGESLTTESDELVSNAINPNRGILDSRNGQLKISGSVPFELPVQNAELIFFGLLGSYVQTDITVGGQPKKQKVFKRGPTLPSFLIEKGFTDINQYFRYLGCRINNLQLTVEPNGLATGSFEVMGKQPANSTTSFDATPTQYVHNVFAGIDGVILEGALGAQFTNFTFNITNGLYDSRVIGSRYSANIGAGKSEVTGELSIMFEDVVMYDKWLNEEQTDLKLTFTLGDNSVEFAFPKVKLNGEASPKIESQEGINITFKWRALVDVGGTNSDVVITVINDIDFDAITA